MLDKDPNNLDTFAQLVKDAVPYVTTLLLSAWGGTVSYIQNLKKLGKPFVWSDFLLGCIVSGFVGLLTHFLCKACNIEGAMAAFLIGTSGYSGAMILNQFEGLRNRILNLPEAKE